jgi:hypothetical protein
MFSSVYSHGEISFTYYNGNTAFFETSLTVLWAIFGSQLCVVVGWQLDFSEFSAVRVLRSKVLPNIRKGATIARGQFQNRLICDRCPLLVVLQIDVYSETKTPRLSIYRYRGNLKGVNAQLTVYRNLLCQYLRDYLSTTDRALSETRVLVTPHFCRAAASSETVHIWPLDNPEPRRHIVYDIFHDSAIACATSCSFFLARQSSIAILVPGLCARPVLTTTATAKSPWH